MYKEGNKSKKPTHNLLKYIWFYMIFIWTYYPFESELIF